MASDEELYRAWCDGDRQAGEELFHRHFEHVFAFFVHRVGAEAQELTQRVFEACITAQYRGEAPFRGFLFGIARNHLLRHLQRGQRGAALVPERVAAQDTGASPSRVAALRERERFVLEAMQRIPLDHQIVLELHYWNELGITEIATAMEIAPGTVKSRLSRAKAALKRQLKRAYARGSLEPRDVDLRIETRALRRALGL